MQEQMNVQMHDDANYVASVGKIGSCPIDELPAKEWLALNVKLQQKKNAIRKELAKVGVLQKKGANSTQNYKYFSERQYKELFTKLLSQNNLEIKANGVKYEMHKGTDKQPLGVFASVQFSLIDVETGFYETSVSTGDGVDNGDKAIYKAYTGAVKYFLANTFMVATGDDAENKAKTTGKVTPAQIKVLEKLYTGELLDKLLEANNITKIEDLSMTKASTLIKKLGGANGSVN